MCRTMMTLPKEPRPTVCSSVKSSRQALRLAGGAAAAGLLPPEAAEAAAAAAAAAPEAEAEEAEGAAAAAEAEEAPAAAPLPPPAAATVLLALVLAAAAAAPAPAPARPSEGMGCPPPIGGLAGLGPPGFAGLLPMRNLRGERRRATNRGPPGTRSSPGFYARPLESGPPGGPWWALVGLLTSCGSRHQRPLAELPVAWGGALAF